MRGVNCHSETVNKEPDNKGPENGIPKGANNGDAKQAACDVRVNVAENEVLQDDSDEAKYLTSQRDDAEGENVHCDCILNSLRVAAFEDA